MVGNLEPHFVPVTVKHKDRIQWLGSWPQKAQVLTGKAKTCLNQKCVKSMSVLNLKRILSNTESYLNVFVVLRMEPTTLHIVSTYSPILKNGIS